jgi:hypothetical protein
MSTITPITLNGTVSSITGQLTYTENDGTGMTGQFQTYEMTITVTPLSTGDGSTRKANEFNAIDISVGMWISDSNGESILRIKSISEKSETTISLVAEDVDMLSYRLNNINSITDGGNVIIFEQNTEGEAIIAETSGFAGGGLDKVQSRFIINEADDRVKFIHDSAPNVERGDIVAVNTSGDLVKYGTAGGSDLKIGTVVDIIRGGKDVFVKPFNDIIRNYKDPESLTGTPGDIYYTDQSNVGEITTTTGGKSTYLQLNTAIASSQIVGTAIPGSGDTVIFNGVTIFDGPGGDTVSDINDFANLINTFTASSNVSASAAATPVSVQGGDFAPNFESNDYYSATDSYIATGIVGQTPTYPEITITDGVQPVVTVVFNNPSDTMVVGGDTYDVITPADIKTKLDAAITAGSLDLTTELFTMDAYDGQSVRITTTGSATGITITNTVNGLFGTPAFGANSWTGIGTSATLGSPVLTLTRAAGGPIEITGSPITGGWINTNGAVSSNSGRVPYLLMIEDETGTSAPDGVETPEDLNQTAAVTSTDGDFTGATITSTPYNDSNVQILVNGINVNLGDGAKDEACYFSADGGATPRTIAEIEGGDGLYWNGSIVGYELDGGDEIDIIYEK